MDVAGEVSTSVTPDTLPSQEPLILRLRVEEFLTAYERCLDDDELERWPELFTEDAVYSIRTRENWDAGLPIALMLCNGRGMLHDRVRAHREANIYAPHVYRHFHGGLQVEVTEDVLVATSNYLVVQTLDDGETRIYQTGRSIDYLIDTVDGLLLQERRVIADTHRVQTLLVTPI
ncbi:nuclear transport factor 2 family protein [Nocardia sp. R6R-6]|uniref:nuclear transport factor 2 family protein n=1 Tax=Nocardia sp. R6R-6 TaxID=3459303 RepID=UPI00403D641C